MTNPPLSKPKPIPIKDRSSVVFVERAKIDVRDGAFVAIDAAGARTAMPVGGVACLLLEPGTRVSHAAVALAAQVGTLLVWVGEGAVRVYAAGQPGGARSDHLLWQARLALDPDARLRVVREMFRRRFGEDAPRKRSIDQLRGIEGARVRRSYDLLAQQYKVQWTRRKYEPKDWTSADVPNRCLSVATSCLHGLSEAAVLAAGYAPAIGFLHVGKPLSFVYDVADLYKTRTVVPEAFRIAALAQKGKLSMPLEREVRLACRDSFRKSGLLKKIIPDIEAILAAGELPKPAPPPDALPPAIPEEETDADDGHRG